MRADGSYLGGVKQEFQKTGFRDCKKEYPDDWGTYRRYETGHCRSDGKPGLQTPTLKQEIWSTIIETYHPDGRYNLPTYSDAPGESRCAA